ncbi:HEAT repeat domain-containing protein [Candidatus Methanoperedens nitratireducens]|uniref:HEAT repeat domain-containing protein n=1 Tax=Candidatus Methanoperedens nitratireducens TaxID=1392998 RepID=A0A284VKC5_9EURY|nr:HEAT repeat domain-containing protein [Candidatus Methanoperedens nitroreducens]SNQ59693.1 hypothetical protein MNV_1270023 [Candidatus Methanoperedens nitroreducens]
MPRKIKENVEIEAFLQKLKNVEWDKRYSLTKALAQLRERAVEPLIQILKDENKDIRMRAAWALGYIMDERAVKPLSQALKDENLDVRNEAKWSLTKLGGKPPSKIMFKKLVIITAAERKTELADEFLKSWGIEGRIYDLLLSARGSHYYTRKFPGYGHRLIKLVYDNVNMIYKKQVAYEPVDANALTISEKSIFVATSKAILHLNTNLEKVDEINIDTLFEDKHHLLLSNKKKYLGSWVLIDSLASSDKAVFISTYGNFIALDKSFKKLSSVQLYDAHDVLIYKNTAYLLDDIVSPFYVYRVDIENPENIQITERISIKGPNQHLSDQWINPELNQWLIVQTCDTSGGCYQNVFTYPLMGNKKEWYLFSWDNVPGNEIHRLRNYLKDAFNIDLADDAEIVKTDDNRMIRIVASTEFSCSTEPVEITITLENNKHALLKIDVFDETQGLQVIEENGKLNIYKEYVNREIWFPYDSIIKNEQNLLDSVRGFGKNGKPGIKMIY